MLAPQPVGIPVPNPSASSTPYWDAAKQGRLLYQRCDDCGTIALRPATVCGHCLSRSLTWTESAGRGTLYSWTIVWRAPRPAFTVPYAPAIVTLDEGYWMVTSIIGCEPDDLRDGMPVTVEFHPASDEINLPYFRPVD